VTSKILQGHHSLNLCAISDACEYQSTIDVFPTKELPDGKLQIVCIGAILLPLLCMYMYEHAKKYIDYTQVYLLYEKDGCIAHVKENIL
jgi:hypothetical protein